MGKFDAATVVEDLEYDFTKYGGGKGVIPEPSTGAVNHFFQGMKNTLKEVRNLSKGVDEVDLEDLSEEELSEQLSKIDQADEGASKYQTATIEYLAELCGGQREYVENPDNPDADKIERVVGGTPSVEDLQTLPYRVLQAFSEWLVGEITPKRKTRDTRPTPQDRRRRST